MKRYELTGVSRCGEPWREMEVDTEGDWVRHEDVVTLLGRAQKAEAELARLREGIAKLHGLIEHIGGEPTVTIRAQLAALLEVRP